MNYAYRPKCTIYDNVAAYQRLRHQLTDGQFVIIDEEKLVKNADQDGFTDITAALEVSRTLREKGHNPFVWCVGHTLHLRPMAAASQQHMHPT